MMFSRAKRIVSLLDHSIHVQNQNPVPIGRLYLNFLPKILNLIRLNLKGTLNLPHLHKPNPGNLLKDFFLVNLLRLQVLSSLLF